jgi:hypothetical protein
MILNRKHVLEIVKLNYRFSNIILSERRVIKVSSAIKNNLIKFLDNRNYIRIKKTAK